MTAELLAEVEPMIAGIASEFGRRHHVHGADSEDFRQDLRIWVLENADDIAAWRNELDPSEFDKYLARCMRNECSSLGVDIKAHATGYKRDDLTWYSKGELKTLLPSMFDRSKWHEPPQSDGRSVKSYAEGNNWVAILADVSRAFSTLRKDDRDLLTAVYRDEYNNVLLSEMFGVTEQTMSYRHERALGRLLDALGGRKPESTRDPWRGRHAISNGAARAMTQGSYDDD